MALPYPGNRPFWNQSLEQIKNTLETPYEQSTGIWKKLHEETNRQYKEMRDRFAKDMMHRQKAMVEGTSIVKVNEKGEITGVVITNPGSGWPDRKPAPGEIKQDIGATLDTCQKQHQREHIWNMLVLSAESS